MSQFSSATGPEIAGAFTKSVRNHWKAFLIEGIILVLLGIAAIVVPLIAGLAATVFLGWILLLSGILGLIATFRAQHAPGFGWAILSAIAAVIAGAALLWNPLAGLVTLTFILIAFFIIDGSLMIILSIVHRHELSGKWEWMLFNGIIDLILAAIIISGMPGTLAWAFGLLVGIDLLFGGIALIAMAMEARPSSNAAF